MDNFVVVCFVSDVQVVRSNSYCWATSQIHMHILSMILWGITQVFVKVGAASHFSDNHQVHTEVLTIFGWLFRLATIQ